MSPFLSVIAYLVSLITVGGIYSETYKYLTRQKRDERHNYIHQKSSYNEVRIVIFSHWQGTMRRHTRANLLSRILVFIWLLTLLGPVTPRCQLRPPNQPGPDRLRQSSSNTSLIPGGCPVGKKPDCVLIVVDHEGVPTPDEIFEECGEDIYDVWMEQSPAPMKFYTRPCSLRRLLRL